MNKKMIAVLVLLSITSGFASAKELTKSEIKQIILSASKHKKYLKTPKVASKNSNTKNTQATTAAILQTVSEPTAQIPKRVTEKILPFVLPSDIDTQSISLNQRGFILIKGANKKAEKKMSNPLYNL